MWKTGKWVYPKTSGNKNTLAELKRIAKLKSN